jgi:hypothetical protein
MDLSPSKAGPLSPPVPPIILIPNRVPPMFTRASP